MRLPTIVLGFAAAAMALPTAITKDPFEFNERDIIEIFALERKAVLSARDLEHAASHVFPHSVIRRRSGDDITIWVDNSFEEGDAPDAGDDSDEATSELDKRQKSRINEGAYYNQGAQFQKLCQGFNSDPNNILTRPNSAFTGGFYAIEAWAGTAHGFFKLSGAKGKTMTDLAIGGSNSGANARVSWKKVGDIEARVGTGDLWSVTGVGLNRQVKYGNSWRASAEGTAYCGPRWGLNTLMNWETKRTDKIV
ncbi:hypothetical protein F5X68DRAFT_190999 [Plectosphaerella plurivora]|uniref:Uncharacterized protein n=1 Tax=Plectosphaerella plurivora TaxID=936078 RepID=A0A9P9ACA2_9PEZI|nr:hypothetical protein F5X68DRAFT_190999 [Plectosphaerella plurivora]